MTSINEVHDAQRLKELQSLPFERKIQITQAKIIEWYNYWKGKVYISFSGGADSTVLLHIARKIFPDIPVVFCNTGMEYPELRKFVKQNNNITWIKPEKSFIDIIKEFGWNYPNKDTALTIYYARKGSQWAIDKFNGVKKDGTKSKFRQRYKPWAYLIDSPFIISNICCIEMKEKPFRKYERDTGNMPIIGTLAEESTRRKDSWLRTGCNAFDTDVPNSTPLSFWTHQDILNYIIKYNVSYASIYGDIINEKSKLKFTGEQTTGCVFCPTGCHLDKENKYQRLAKTHPQMYHRCIDGGEYNVDGKWIPNKQGLGLGKLLDYVGVKYRPLKEDVKL